MLLHDVTELLVVVVYTVHASHFNQAAQLNKHGIKM